MTSPPKELHQSGSQPRPDPFRPTRHCVFCLSSLTFSAMPIRFSGLNFEAFSSDFAVSCLKRGVPGFLLMKRHLSQDNTVSLESDKCSNLPGFEEIGFHRDKQLLMHDLVSSFTPNARFQLGEHLGSDVFASLLLSLDCFTLWDEMSKMSSWFKDTSRKRDETEPRLGFFKAIMCMFKCDYVRASWHANDNSIDLQEDIVAICSNQALICALVLTITLPLLIESSAYIDENYFAQFYTLFIGVASCAEAAAVLVCLRNLLAVKLVDEENVHKFTQLAHSALLLPNKLNVLAVNSTAVGLLLFGFWKFGPYRTLIFGVVAVVPNLYASNFYIAQGIQALHSVQPWDKHPSEEVSYSNGHGSSQVGLVEMSGTKL